MASAAQPAPADPVSDRSRSAGDDVRSRLLDAALVEFAAHGFEGASTRDIAARAGAHQPQINYYFESKAELWRAAVEAMFTEIEGLLDGADEAPRDDMGRDEARRVLTAVIVRFVAFAARRPELSRIMMQEAMAPSERLDWLIERYSAPAYRAVTALWRRACDEARAAVLDERFVYYVIVGAGSLPFANAPEAERLIGADPTSDALVAAHADGLVALLIGP